MNSDFGSAAQPAMDTVSPQSSTNNARYVRFGPFQIDQRRQQVFRGGARLRLQGKVYQVLLVLLQKQGEVVSREELKQALWPADTHVNYDANVNTTVNKLRQALGESTEKPLYIETIPRKGYSFISNAEFSDQPFPASALINSEQTAGSSDNASREDTNPPSSSRWRSIIIVGLILVGMLLGAGAATYWISHFAPQIRHSLAKNAHRPPTGNAS